MPSVAAVTDGLSASAADGRHLAKPVAARVLSLANPGPLAIGQAVWTGGTRPPLDSDLNRSAAGGPVVG